MRRRRGRRPERLLRRRGGDHPTRLGLFGEGGGEGPHMVVVALEAGVTGAGRSVAAGAHSLLQRREVAGKHEWRKIVFKSLLVFGLRIQLVAGETTLLIEQAEMGAVTKFRKRVLVLSGPRGLPVHCQRLVGPAVEAVAFGAEARCLGRGEAFENGGERRQSM